MLPAPKEEASEGVETNDCCCDKVSDHGQKIGRKGDPRMHRAVSARLANPEMSLAEALKAGGFDYADGNDPSCMDSENITLGQRKNQLSRRLRLAKKPDSGKEHDNVKDECLDDSSRISSVAPTKPDDKVASKQIKSASAEKVAGKKRPPPSESDESSNDGVAASNAKTLRDLQQRLSEMEKQRQLGETAVAAKFHPDFQHIIIPRVVFPSAVSIAGDSLGQVESSAAQASLEVAIQEQLMANGFTGGLNGLSLPASKTSMAPPSVSNVAVRSLTATAKSVGMTLEQLALVLSTSKNLMQLLSGLSSDEASDPESQQQKHDLALRLHEYETKTLYSRCMLLAGFNHKDTREGDATQLRFALEAWQKEGKRLQDLIRSNTDVTCDEAPLIHNVAGADTDNFKTVQQLSQKQQLQQLSQQQQLQQLQLQQQKQQEQQQRNHEQQQQLLQRMQQKLSSLGGSSLGGSSILGNTFAASGLGGGLAGLSGSSSVFQLAEQLSKAQHQGFRHSHSGGNLAGLALDLNHRNHGQSDHSLSCQYSSGRHVHRLAGRCGHRAILHQPADGHAHIDFVVGNTVECYGGSSPEASADGNAVWPSRYRCEELDCKQADQCSKAYIGEHQHSTECKEGSKAKIIDLDSVDLSGKEWSSDFNEDVLMSLFGLGNNGGGDQVDARSSAEEQNHLLHCHSDHNMM